MTPKDAGNAPVALQRDEGAIEIHMAAGLTFTVLTSPSGGAAP